MATKLLKFRFPTTEGSVAVDNVGEAEGTFSDDYFVVSGRCVECDAPVYIYLHYGDSEAAAECPDGFRHPVPKARWL